MDRKEVLVCRLCFNTCSSDFIVMDNEILSMLNFVFLARDFEISQESVICISCTHELKSCFDFKTRCLHKRELKSDNFEHAQFNMPKMYLTENTISAIATTNTCDKCCLCTEVQDEYIFLSEEENFMASLFEKYFPEIELKVTKESKICNACYKSLHKYLIFINTRSNTEKNTNEYCEVEETCFKGQVEPSRIGLFTPNSELQCNIYDSVSGIKVETEYEEVDHKVILKVEDEDYLRINKQEFGFSENMDTTIEMKYDDDGSNDSPHSPEILRAKHTESHVNTLDETVDKHDVLERTKPDNNLSEPAAYKCETCPFLTTYKWNLRRHMVTHRSTSEVTMHKCDLCAFETKHEGSLRHHMLIHKTKSEITMYECEICPFQSKYDKGLRRHMLTHKSAEDVTVYGCDTCDFVTKHKKNIQRHMITHKNAWEVPTYKCQICSFQTKHNRSLKCHMVSHKRRLEVTRVK